MTNTVMSHGASDSIDNKPKQSFAIWIHKSWILPCFFAKSFDSQGLKVEVSRSEPNFSPNTWEVFVIYQRINISRRGKSSQLPQLQGQISITFGEGPAS